jgi:hypothetical protein
MTSAVAPSRESVAVAVVAFGAMITYSVLHVVHFPLLMSFFQSPDQFSDSLFMLILINSLESES